MTDICPDEKCAQNARLRDRVRSILATPRPPSAEEVAAQSRYEASRTPATMRLDIAGFTQRWVSRNVFGEPPSEEEAKALAIAAVCHGYAAHMALLVLEEADPALCAAFVADLADALDDGGAIGEWLYPHAAAYGLLDAASPAGAE